jgi:hypothetical protein
VPRDRIKGIEKEIVTPKKTVFERNAVDGRGENSERK